MPPNLILHAGSHKTGTTAIQTFAATHRAALAGRGVLYPDLTPLGRRHDSPQHAFAHALADKDRTLPAAEAARLAGLWAGAAPRTGAATAFVSSEPLYRHLLRADGEQGAAGWRTARARYLDRVAAALAPFETEVVLVFRRPDDFVRSLFQENVLRASGTRWTSFAAFRAHALGGALRYADQAALFTERFARVRCLVYEDLPPGADFCQAFFAAIGLDVAGLGPVGVVRESLSPVETLTKLTLDAALGAAPPNSTALDGPGARARLVKFVRSPGVAARIAARFGPGPFGLWESAAARAEFLDAVAPEMERLRAAAFPDRATLFAPPTAGAPPPPVPAFDAALTADLAADLAAACAATPGPRAARGAKAALARGRTP